MENKSKLNRESFRPLFGSWWPKIEKFFYEGGFDPIYEKLKFDAKRGIKIAPKSEVVFRAFEECDYNSLKLIVVGMCPYHTFKDGTPVADGLALSCGITKYPQPSLSNFFDAIERELNDGLCLPCVKNPDLTYLANSGILLLNAGLTVAVNKPGSHNFLWEPFMKFLFTEVLDTAGVPIILLGREAQKLEKYINPFTTIFRLSHPASTSYKNDGSEWDSEGTFKQIQTILKHRNNEIINWFDESLEAPF